MVIIGQYTLGTVGKEEKMTFEGVVRAGWDSFHHNLRKPAQIDRDAQVTVVKGGDYCKLEVMVDDASFVTLTLPGYELRPISGE